MLYRISYRHIRIISLTCQHFLSIAKSIFQTDKIWASSLENLFSEVYEQQMHRPACAYAQSDQRLCYSFFGKYHIWFCYKRNFNFPAGLYSWWDWFESRLSETPKTGFLATRPKWQHIFLFTYLYFMIDSLAHPAGC